MRLIDADKLPYSNIKTNEYGYVETTKTVVLEEGIANARTVQAISLDRIKQAREEISELDGEYLTLYEGVNKIGNGLYVEVDEVLEILDKLIAESEEKNA